MQPGVERQEGSASRVPEGQRVYAIGDIHGRADLLDELHEAIHIDALGAGELEKSIVYLGDYVDRGFAVRGVIDRLLSPSLPGFTAVHLKGNHEDLMLSFLEDSRFGESWFLNGAGATVRSYEVELAGVTRHDFEAARRALNEQLPARHRAFLDGLGLTHRIGDYLFVHAGIRPGVALDEQRGEDLMWIRSEFLEAEADHGVRVVHGHSISQHVVVRDNRIGVDTGAFASGCLSCLILEGTGIRVLST